MLTVNAKKTRAHTYIVVLKIENMKVGGVYNYELHCTLVLWFCTKANRVEVEEACSLVAAQAKPIWLRGKEAAYFGEKHDLEVRLVEKTHELDELHNGLLDELQRLSDFSLLETEYSRDGWRPHVTSMRGKSFKPEQRALASSMYLIEAREDITKGQKDVFAEVKFGHETAA